MDGVLAKWENASLEDITKPGYFKNRPVEKRVFVPYGESKSDFIKNNMGLKSNDVLIDDFSKNLLGWHGIGIKMYNHVNGTKGTWKNYSVKTSMPPTVLSNQIYGIILTAC